jgi:hypothetical protein
MTNEREKSERTDMKNKEAFSSMAATLGARGGKVSKRKPGRLRYILLEICGELGSMENHAVFRYWQVHEIAAAADNTAIGTCWLKHGLWARPQVSYFMNKNYETKGDQYLPECVERPHDSEFVYHYFDGKDELTTNAHTIRSTLYRIRNT